MQSITVKSIWNRQRKGRIAKYNGSHFLKKHLKRSGYGVLSIEPLQRITVNAAKHDGKTIDFQSER
jgi:hypothetical protein